MHGKWLLIMLLAVALGSCGNGGGNSSKASSARTLTVKIHASGLFGGVFDSGEVTQQFFFDKQGRPTLATYSRKGFADERKKFEWTDTSVTVSEGRAGECVYKIRNGLIISRREPKGGRTDTYAYDAGRHIVRAGMTEYVWQGSQLTLIQSKSADGGLMIEEQVDYDPKKPASQAPMATIMSRRWHKWWLLPLLLQGYFGEPSGDVPFKISHPDGHFDLFRSTFDSDGRLKSLQSVSDHETMDFYWENF